MSKSNKSERITASEIIKRDKDLGEKLQAEWDKTFMNPLIKKTHEIMEAYLKNKKSSE